MRIPTPEKAVKEIFLPDRWFGDVSLIAGVPRPLPHSVRHQLGGGVAEEVLHKVTLPTSGR